MRGLSCATKGVCEACNLAFLHSIFTLFDESKFKFSWIKVGFLCEFVRLEQIERNLG